MVTNYTFRRCMLDRACGMCSLDEGGLAPNGRRRAGVVPGAGCVKYGTLAALRCGGVRGVVQVQ